ncbi:DUF418 domain-containing protein [Sphingosinicella sp.]|uniref:DUF418 domain-containing protein n=1 Tax=Sphingosinicella sp. TaxID=1917971 RepID=UPI004037CB2C
MTDSAVPAAATPARIAQLDVVRGVAVMGILAMNIVAFAMPFQAYFNPMAYGTESAADLASWAFNFVFVDGKMRGLFSFLFGASTLLVIEKAEAAGLSAARIHYARMFWLLVFGLIHFYLIWFGDILSHYALIGLLLFFFRRLAVRALLIWGAMLVLAQCLMMAGFAFGAFTLSAAAAASNPDPEAVRQWPEMSGMFGAPGPAAISEKLAHFLGPWSEQVHDRLVERGAEPFTSTLFFGWETLAYMLFGMAALKSGFFRGQWAPARYWRVAAIGLGIAIPAYVLIAWLLWSRGFAAQNVIAAFSAQTPFRPFIVIAYAALIVLAARNGGWLAERIAAAGRAAFTNYLGTSILMTTLFYGYGFGLFGELSRIELWLPVLGVWVLMLLWSKPWLERFHYGPLEWLWRSLSRLELQPMRRREPATASG